MLGGIYSQRIGGFFQPSLYVHRTGYTKPLSIQNVASKVAIDTDQVQQQGTGDPRYGPSMPAPGPGEKHVYMKTDGALMPVRANFAGPGTNLVERLRRGDKPINEVDRIAKAHDLRYGLATNYDQVRDADNVMINALKNTKQDPVSRTAASAVMQGKLLLEDKAGVKRGTFAQHGTDHSPETTAMLQAELAPLAQEGLGGGRRRFAKGSPEAKAFMAALRAKRVAGSAKAAGFAGKGLKLAGAGRKRGRRAKSAGGALLISPERRAREEAAWQANAAKRQERVDRAIRNYKGRGIGKKYLNLVKSNMRGDKEAFGIKNLAAHALIPGYTVAVGGYPGQAAALGGILKSGDASPASTITQSAKVTGNGLSLAGNGLSLAGGMCGGFLPFLPMLAGMALKGLASYGVKKGAEALYNKLKGQGLMRGKGVLKSQIAKMQALFDQHVGGPVKEEALKVLESMKADPSTIQEGIKLLLPLLLKMANEMGGQEGSGIMEGGEQGVGDLIGHVLKMYGKAIAEKIKQLLGMESALDLPQGHSEIPFQDPSTIKFNKGSGEAGRSRGSGRKRGRGVVSKVKDTVEKVIKTVDKQISKLPTNEAAVIRTILNDIKRDPTVLENPAYLTAKAVAISPAGQRFLNDSLRKAGVPVAVSISA